MAAVLSVADVGREDSEAEAVGEESRGRYARDGDGHFDTAADAGFNAGGGVYFLKGGNIRAPGACDEERDGHGVALQERPLAAALGSGSGSGGVRVVRPGDDDVLGVG